MITHKILKFVDTLVYYDGPQLVHAIDSIGTNYICVLVKNLETVGRFLCVSVSPTRLNYFLNGDIDLRVVLESPEIEEFFLGIEDEQIIDTLDISPISKSEILEQWLPEPGFFFKKQLISDETIIKEAVTRNRAIISITLNPPEARSETKISAEHLGQAVQLIQRLIKQAFKKALTQVDSSTRERIDIAENYELEVYSFSEGSFKLNLQNKALAGLWGYPEIERAFSLLDSVNTNLDSPEATVDSISEYGGHFAGAYRDLVRYITDNDMPITYEWTTPEQPSVNPIRISTRQAKPIYELLITRQDITKEIKVLRGTVFKIDMARHTWGLKSIEDNRNYTGSVEDSAGISLGGITTETTQYEFTCEEILEEEKGTGRESTHLKLISFTELFLPPG